MRNSTSCGTNSEQDKKDGYMTLRRKVTKGHKSIHKEDDQSGPV